MLVENKMAQKVKYLKKKKRYGYTILGISQVKGFATEVQTETVIDYQFFGDEIAFDHLYYSSFCLLEINPLQHRHMIFICA